MGLLRAAIEVPLGDTTRVAEARRAAMGIGRDVGLSEDDLARLALVVTELGTNVIRYGDDGSLIVAPALAGIGAVDVYALDRGPGIVDIGRAMADGYSSSGGSGSGLGAIYRHAELFEVHSAIGKGTVVVARVGVSSRADSSWQIAGVALPYPGELRCGDVCVAVPGPRHLTVAVIDGVGHGDEAADASTRAAEIVQDMRDASPTATLLVIHDQLRLRRGAVAGVALIDLDQRLVHYGGVGNVTAILLGADGPHHMTSAAGVLGQRTSTIKESVYPFPAGCRLVMHSDGLTSHQVEVPLAVGIDRHPLIQVALRIHDRRRLRDDLSVLMVREAPPPGP